MVGLKSVLFLVAACYLVSSNPVENELWEKAIKLTSKIGIREAENAAKAIRGIEIKTAACKVQLASMANNALAAVVYNIYSFNVLIPNIANDEAAHTFLVAATLALSKTANEVQQVLHGDPEILKEKLAAFLDVIKERVSLFVQNFKVTNEFTHNQIQNGLDQGVYAIYKLKLQANYFHEPNKNIDNKISEALAELGQTLKSLPNADKKTEVVLRHLIRDFSGIVERAVNKLQNWIEINAKDTKNVDIVKDVSRTLSEIYDKLNRAITGHHTAAFLKDQLHSINGLAIKEIQKLSEIEYVENLGGQEFIRDTIFSALAVAVAYSENLKTLTPVA